MTLMEQFKYVQLLDLLQMKAREYVKWRIDLDMWDPKMEDEDVASKICEYVGENVMDFELDEYEGIPTNPNQDIFDYVHDLFWQQVEVVKGKVKQI